MADTDREKQGTPRKSRGANIAVGLLAVLILVPAAYGFITKLVEFVRTSRSGGQGGFAILPVLIYLSVSAGFLCLFVWAVFRGMFHDIEKPKYTMLENEDRLERGGHAASPR